MHETAVPVLQGLGMLGAPLLMLLYSRIRQEHILDNYTRGQVHGYISANPGEQYSSIRDALGLNNGTLAYHLQRLENGRMIKSAAGGARRRYYPANMKLPEQPKDGLTEVQRMIVSVLLSRPGISQRGIGRVMDLSPATVNFHLGRLEARGIVRRERVGMRNRCFVMEAPSERAGGPASGPYPG
jgi:predicted transcriptional regulator